MQQQFNGETPTWAGADPWCAGVQAAAATGEMIRLRHAAEREAAEREAAVGSQRRAERAAAVLQERVGVLEAQLQVPGLPSAFLSLCEARHGGDAWTLLWCTWRAWSATAAARAAAAARCWLRACSCFSAGSA